jgi:hypothetical protein
MSLGDTNNNVVTVLFASLGLLEHLIGFAHAGRGSYEDSELANATFLTSSSFKERLRRGSMFGIAPLIHHHCATASNGQYLASSREPIKRQIEQQNVHARLTQQSKEPSFGVVPDQLADPIFRQIPRLGDTGYLE